MWCRQLNPEGDSDAGLVQNRGAELWILGAKFEGRGTRIRTESGGKTEVVGVFNYGPGVADDDHRPMFAVNNATFRVFGLRELAFGGNCFLTKVREQKDGELRELTHQQEPGWIGWAVYDGWQPKTNGQ
jgi:hypothetical protein